MVDNKINISMEICGCAVSMTTDENGQCETHRQHQSVVPIDKLNPLTTPVSCTH